MNIRQRMIYQRWQRRVRDLIPVGVGVVIGATGFFLADRAMESFTVQLQPLPQAEAPLPAFADCDAARAAGATPLYRGQPGYNRRLDADGDGVACEPHPR